MKKAKIHHDPIVEEIRMFRKQHAEKYNNNLDQIFTALKKAEEVSGRKFVNFETTPPHNKKG